MSVDREASATAALIQFLEKERVAVLRADFSALGNILEEKEHLLRMIAELDVPRSELAKIRKLLARNKNLLEASGEGIKSVTHRLSEMRSAQTSIRTYSNSGESRTIGNASAKVEWRA